MPLSFSSFSLSISWTCLSSSMAVPQLSVPELSPVHAVNVDADSDGREGLFRVAADPTGCSAHLLYHSARTSHCWLICVSSDMTRQRLWPTPWPRYHATAVVMFATCEVAPPSSWSARRMT